MPIPSLEVPVSHHKLFVPVSPFEAFQKASCVAVPLPVKPPMPDTVVHFHTDAVESQERTSFAEQPPSNLRPSEVTSSPELLDRAVVVPVVVASIVMSSALSAIPYPAPTLRIVAPGPVPPVKPQPGVLEVIAYDPTLFESRRVPDLPYKRFISVADAVTAVPPMYRFVILAEPATSSRYSGLEVPMPTRPFTSLK